MSPHGPRQDMSALSAIYIADGQADIVRPCPPPTETDKADKSGQRTYDLLLDQARLVHRPQTVEGLRQAVEDLLSSGLSIEDVARALALTPSALMQLLDESIPPAPEEAST